MKITDVRAIPLAIPMDDVERHSPWWGRQSRQVVVEVHTDAGLVGLGETFFEPAAVGELVHAAIAPRLLGQDPLDARLDRAALGAGYDHPGWGIGSPSSGPYDDYAATCTRR